MELESLPPSILPKCVSDVFFFSFYKLSFIIILIARCINFRRNRGASSTTTFSTFSFRKGKGVLNSVLLVGKGRGLGKQKKKKKDLSHLRTLSA